MQTKQYEVERILDKTTIKGKVHYFVKWKGYSKSESTWEPKGNLLQAKDSIREFKEKKSLQKIRKKLEKKIEKINNEKNIEVSTKKYRKIKIIEDEDVKVESYKKSELEIEDVIDINKINSGIEGNLYNHVPNSIIGHRIYKTNNGNIIEYFVKWNQRDDLSEPDQSYIYSNDLNKNYQYLIVEYLENKFIK